MSCIATFGSSPRWLIVAAIAVGCWFLFCRGRRMGGIGTLCLVAMIGFGILWLKGPSFVEERHETWSFDREHRHLRDRLREHFADHEHLRDRIRDKVRNELTRYGISDDELDPDEASGATTIELKLKTDHLAKFEVDDSELAAGVWNLIEVAVDPAPEDSAPLDELEQIVIKGQGYDAVRLRDIGRVVWRTSGDRRAAAPGVLTVRLKLDDKDADAVDLEEVLEKVEALEEEIDRRQRAVVTAIAEDDTLELVVLAGRVRKVLAGDERPASAVVAADPLADGDDQDAALADSDAQPPESVAAEDGVAPSGEESHATTAPSESNGENAEKKSVAEVVVEAIGSLLGSPTASKDTRQPPAPPAAPSAPQPATAAEPAAEAVQLAEKAVAAAEAVAQAAEEASEKIAETAEKTAETIERAATTERVHAAEDSRPPLQSVADDVSPPRPSTPNETPAPSTPDARPAWVDAPDRLESGVYHATAKSGPFATHEEAEEALLHAVYGKILAYVDRFIEEGAGERLRSEQSFVNYIAEQTIKEQWQEHVNTPLRPLVEGQGILDSDSMVQLHARLEFTDRVRSDLYQRWRDSVVDDRLRVTGVGAGTVLLLLSTLFGYLKLDTATKGYYSTRLKLLAGALVATVVTTAAMLLDLSISGSITW